MTLAAQYLHPSAERARRVDGEIRRQLAGSVDYLAGLVPAAAGAGHWRNLHAAVAAGPVSPWVFGLYANLVAELSRQADVSAYPGDLAAAAAMPAATPPLAYGDSVVPGAWWPMADRLFDTDKTSPFRAVAPSSATAALCSREVKAGLDLLAAADVPFFDDVTATLRVVVLGVPAPETGDPFDGASTFFLWGLSLINAANRRDPVAIIDLLVHESGHLLLFGLAGGASLLTNQAGQRIASPLRSDLRPVEGVFHAAFVATRVHCAMTRLIAARPGAAIIAAAERHRERNGTAGRVGTKTLLAEAHPTERGAEIIAALQEYWQGV